MPGSHGEITVVEQNRVDNDNNKTRRKKKNKNEEDEVENENQLVTPSVSKPRRKFTDGSRKKHRSRSGSCKGGCFSVMRPRRTEEEGSPSSDPNDESFTHDMLRVMLENSDFFSDECNPHR
ncbi:uncharacterized protein LOC108810092 [Raphanus sativus]|uniref:Uncharacterized protein LOC108810092 n=1 Tax=Raphanus sativus TaxID=3726 RepID=A0A6J0JPW6_RAPSA|nr:uncharacterized protein LOC108810092 [Raphanus sativus]